MVQGLPHDAPLWRAEDWSNTEELLAEIVEMLDITRFTLAAAAGVKLRGSPLKVPRPDRGEEAPRPDIKSNRVESLDDMTKIAAFFNRNPV